MGGKGYRWDSGRTWGYNGYEGYGNIYVGVGDMHGYGNGYMHGYDSNGMSDGIWSYKGHEEGDERSMGMD